MYCVIAQPGYVIIENAYCTPLITIYNTLSGAIQGCPSCAMIFYDGGHKDFSTCDDEAEIKVSKIGSRVYIKSKYLFIWYVFVGIISNY